LINCILSNVWQKQHQARSQKRKGRGDEERITSGSNFVVTCGCLESVERVGTSESADFADGSCDAVVLTTV
jgi:hypothetical protein